jgi:hypothetical protein
MQNVLLIIAFLFKDILCLWMVSPLLEVQLKPHHKPFFIRYRYSKSFKILYQGYSTLYKTVYIRKVILRLQIGTYVTICMR